MFGSHGPQPRLVLNAVLEFGYSGQHWQARDGRLWSKCCRHNELTGLAFLDCTQLCCKPSNDLKQNCQFSPPLLGHVFRHAHRRVALSEVIGLVGKRKPSEPTGKGLIDGLDLVDD
ncbi:hypothetical protein D9M72_648450 [compost metagenome]